MTRDRLDAEDVVQDVFVKLCQRRNPGKHAPVFPAGWLSALVRNKALDLLRQKKSIAGASLRASREAAPEYRTPEKELLAAQAQQLLRQALARLPAQQRHTLELACLEGLSQAEIAARCTTPLGTVKARCRAAQSRLGQLLKSVEVDRGGQAQRERVRGGVVHVVAALKRAVHRGGQPAP